MHYEIQPMNLAEARAVADWRYPPPFDFYDMHADDSYLEIWLANGGSEGRYSVRAGGGLVGFFSFGDDARVNGGDYSEEALDIGLGLRPDLTSRGLGVRFMESGLGFARRSFSPVGFRLTVAEFNERAISAYERVGFTKTQSFLSEMKNEVRPFVTMTLPA